MKKGNNVLFIDETDSSKKTLSSEVANWLIERKHPVTDINGHDPKSLGGQKSFGFLNRKPSNLFTCEIMGTISFTESRNWDASVYGQKYVDKVNKLVDKMATAFGVKITTHLVQKETMTERDINKGYLNF